MGRRGPAPKPTAIKKLEGTYRRDRAPQNEPRPRVMIPPPPKWLHGAALREYRRAAKLLFKARVLTELDGAALAVYANEFALWREAVDALAVQGAVVPGPGGQVRANPWQGIANTAFKNMRSIMAEFGMTPASRTRVEAAPEDDHSLATMLREALGEDGE